MEKAKKFTHLLIALTLKEIKVRYSQAQLGFLWIIINPLLQMLIIGTVFAFFFGQNQINYYLFLFTGLLSWEFFAASWENGTTSVIKNRELIKKAPFPKIIIPFSTVLGQLINFCIALLLPISFLFLTNKAQFSLFLLPLVILWQTIFTAGLSLLTASLHPSFRDTSFIVRGLLRAWFYLTPVLYPLDILPASLIQIIKYNPAAGFILSYQNIICQTNNPLPFSYLSLQILASLAIFILGYYSFQKKAPYFIDLL